MSKGQKLPILSRIKTMIAAWNLTNGGNVYYQPFGPSRKIQDTTTIQGQIASYNFCPPVTSIINRKTKAFLNGYWWFEDKDGNESKSTELNDLKKLMESPNPLQSWRALISQAKIYEQIFGECFIYALRPVGMKKVSQLWVIPNWIGKFEYSQYYGQAPLFSGFDKFVLETTSGKSELPVSDILHVKDISANSLNQLSGQSRLVSLQDPISNIIAAYESRNVLITRRGAIGILSNDSKDATGILPLKPDEKQELQDEFSRYGITKDKFQAIITNANLKWQSMTFPTKDLLLFEEVEDDTRQIADNLDYPMYLLGFKNGSTFNNVNEAKKGLYQDAIIPESEIWAESFTRFFGLQNAKFSISYDHLEVFKKGEKERAETIEAINRAFEIAYRNQIVTREEWRSELEYDPVKFNGSTFYQMEVQNGN